MYDFYGLGGKCSITIQTGINTSTTINFSNFEHVDQTKKEFQNESFGELRECCLTFFDNNDNNTVQIAKIPISISELEEFIFELYFNTIIDLVLNEEQSEYVNEIIGRVFGSNWFNAG